MTRYVILKRSDGDGFMPGDIVTDPHMADVLVARGFLQELPDNLEDQLPKADEKAAKAAAKAEAKAEREETKEEEAIRKEGEAALLANRPDAKKLAKYLDVELDEIFELSQEDYDNGLSAMNEADAEPDVKVGAVADDKPAKG